MENSQVIFALILASLRVPTDYDNTSHTMKKKTRKCLQKPDSRHQLQLQLLNQLHLSLLSEIPNPSSSHLTIPGPIISLLPTLLDSKCPEVVCKCTKFLGAASLYSLEMNQQIADDEGILKSLISGLAGWKGRRTLIDIGNAILDLATTSVGRKHLLLCSGLNSIIVRFLQVPKTSVPLQVALFAEGKRSEIRHRIGFNEDELPVLLLDAAITLINACSIGQLESIPSALLKPLRAYVKRLWKMTWDKILLGDSVEFNEHGHFFLSHITTCNLAESIFRLTISAGEFTTPVPVDTVKRSIFGQDLCNFNDFIANHWEIAPLLMRRSPENNIFNFFEQFLDFDNTIPSNLSTMLKTLVSCPPIASDELDILNFLNDVRGHLGFPMIYKQDIRVLKTLDSSGETHFMKGPKFLYINDILRCEEACKEGHTIALRGMGFRFENIAAVVDGLAHLFGQPSAGANMYLTPPNSQGLTRHYDDHCVFVCQLTGAKRWKVIPRSRFLLPRLYEPFDRLDEVDESNECGQFLLREGDVLYIPRGFLHEACTFMENEKPDDVAEFSLHLTLGIEVEPPFECEGFTHLALHNWLQKQKLSLNSSCDSLCGSLNVISVGLMHVAIKQIGDDDPMFRKACLVGVIPSLSDNKDHLYQNQKIIFSQLIKTIDAKSSFSDALEIVTLSLMKNEDPFRQLRWLQHLDDGDNDGVFELHNWKIPQVQSEESFMFMCNEHKEKAEASFTILRSKFCNEVVFEEVEKCYNMLLEKYRKVRKQYTNGMLSLHRI